MRDSSIQSIIDSLSLVIKSYYSLMLLLFVNSYHC